MKRLAASVVVVLMLAATSSASVVINFEGFAGNTVVDDQYLALGADFNGSATILSADDGSLNLSFPPHSGTAVIYDSTAVIRINAFGQRWSSAAGYVTGNTVITLEAYDIGGNLLDSDATPGANYMGAGTGLNPNILLSVSGADIAYVLFHDGGNSFTVDDFQFEPNAVPEPSSLLVWSLIGGVVTGAVCCQRRQVA